MKLGIFYSVYNGTELLNGSIRNILPYVDVVLLHYQTTSNRGNRSNEFEEWHEKNKDTLSDKVQILKYRPRNEWDKTKKNERIKYNIAAKHLLEQGCTHFMMAACDHYYEPEQFAWAKAQAKDYQVTWSKMYTYYKYPTWQLTPMENYYMPFICQLTANTKIGYGFPVRVDPANGVAPFKTYRQFEPKELILHHYSMIRQDIRNKFVNAASNINWKNKVNEFVNEYENYDIEVNKGVSYFSGDGNIRKIKVVPNWFNI